MNGGEHRGRRRAVAQELGQEERRDLPRVRGILEQAFRRERVALEPFEELFAVRRDDVGLRIVDVRVDEARDEQPARAVDDRSAGRYRRGDGSPIVGPLNAAVADDERPVFVITRFSRRRLDRRRNGGLAAIDLDTGRGRPRRRSRSQVPSSRLAPCATHAVTRCARRPSSA
jgi:hypothetical protein